MTGHTSRAVGQDVGPVVPSQRDPAGQHPARPDEPATRRERQRRETIEQIKASARALLAPHHSGELSLRAVARDVGIAPSGIYRYFESRQELVSAVAQDAYASARAALDAELGRVRSETHLAQALTLAHAYRRWCLEHRAEFSLLFATQHLEEDADVIGDERLHLFFGPPLAQFATGIRTGAVDVSAAALRPGSALSGPVEALRRADPHGLSVREVAVLLSGWSALHGFVTLELLGPLAWFHQDMDASYEQHARAVLVSMGYRDPSLVE